MHPAFGALRHSHDACLVTESAMTSWKSLAFLALFAVACGKKKEPETAAVAPLTTTIGVVDLNRKTIAEGQDERWLNAPVTVKNSLAGEITVNKIEYKMMSGTQEVGGGTSSLSDKIAAGESKTFTLSSKFTWDDRTELQADKATVTGTVYFTGPNGNERTDVFNLVGDIKSE